MNDDNDYDEGATAECARRGAVDRIVGDDEGSNEEDKQDEDHCGEHRREARASPIARAARGRARVRAPLRARAYFLPPSLLPLPSFLPIFRWASSQRGRPRARGTRTFPNTMT